MNDPKAGIHLRSTRATSTAVAPRRRRRRAVLSAMAPASGRADAGASPLSHARQDARREAPGAAVTWTKVCENFYDDPRLMRAGEDATDLHLRAMVYSNRFGTDGFCAPVVPLGPVEEAHPSRSTPSCAPSSKRELGRRKAMDGA